MQAAEQQGNIADAEHAAGKAGAYASHNGSGTTTAATAGPFQLVQGALK